MSHLTRNLSVLSNRLETSSISTYGYQFSQCFDTKNACATVSNKILFKTLFAKKVVIFFSHTSLDILELSFGSINTFDTSALHDAY